jgi:Protein of unknown function (DUF3616)
MNKPTRQVRLQFDATAVALDSLSAVEIIGNYLFVAADESTSIERLKTTDGGQSYAEQRSFPVATFFTLAEQGDEIDIEGLSVSHHYLWLVGSHSTKRQKPKSRATPQEQIAQLASVKREMKRYLLARIPIIKDQTSGEVMLLQSCPNPDAPAQLLTPARLDYSEHGNELMNALKDDEHLGLFISTLPPEHKDNHKEKDKPPSKDNHKEKDKPLSLAIPGKDNGLDIEGLAARGNRLFIGLRGPVLRGWAMILEVEVKDVGGGLLALEKIGPNGRRYRKHFLKLNGLGLRDLYWQGNDLLILAGPTMDLDGPVHVFRWRGAASILVETITDQDKLQMILDVPYGGGQLTPCEEDLDPDVQKFGVDHAEGMALLADGGSPPSLLIVYDAPKKARKEGTNAVLADVFTLNC